MSGFLTWVCVLFLPLARATPVPERAARDIPVHESAAADATTIFTIEAGQRYWRMDGDAPWTKIKVRVLGTWQSGYIDLESLKLPLIEPRKFALAVGGALSRLTQAPRAFQTSDDVNYQMTSLTSTTVFPLIVAQWREHGFWRMRLGARRTAYTGQAKSLIQGSAVQPVQLEHAMIALSTERAWSPEFARWSRGGGYLSGLLELAQAYAVKVRYAGQTLATDSQNLATYTGVGLALGVQHRLSEAFELSAEVRFVDEINQDPSVFNLELGLHVAHWF